MKSKRGKRHADKEVTQPIRKESERDAILSYFFKRGDLRDYAMFIFGVYTGRRIGDILALNVGDVAKIDNRGYLRIVNRLSIREEKTGKGFSFTVHQRVKSALSKYLKQRREKAPSLGALLLEPLFKSQKHRKDSGEYRLTKRHALRILSNAARECGLNYRVGTHSMRKTFGYVLYNSGYDIVRIQQALNHSSTAYTLSYIGVTQDDIDELFSGFGEYNLDFGRGPAR